MKAKMTKEYGFNHESMLDLGEGPEKAHNLASNISAYAVQTGKDKKDE